jgi:hypothetical protein
VENNYPSREGDTPLKEEMNARLSSPVQDFSLHHSQKYLLPLEEEINLVVGSGIHRCTLIVSIAS